MHEESHILLICKMYLFLYPALSSRRIKKNPQHDNSIRILYLLIGKIEKLRF